MIETFIEFFLGLIILQLILVFGISCYKCMQDDFLCLPGRLGEKEECKPDVTHCIKTWTGKFVALEQINLSKQNIIDNTIIV
jgi:hypothetical protein